MRGQKKMSKVVIGRLGMLVVLASCVLVSTAGAATEFETPVLVYSAANIYGADMAIKSDGTAGIAYAGQDAINIGVVEVGATGVISNTSIQSSAWNNRAPSIAYDTSGEAHVAWWKTGDNDLQYNHTAGGAWQGVEVIDKWTGAGVTDLYADPQGNVHFSWLVGYDNMANRRRYQMKKADGTWEHPVIPGDEQGRYVQDSTEIAYSQGGANILASNADDVYIFSQARAWFINQVGPGYKTVHSLKKTTTGDFAETRIAESDYPWQGGINSVYSNVMDPAFRGSEIDLATIEYWGDQSKGNINLYMDVTSVGLKTSIQVANTGGTASQVSMVIDDDGMHYLFFIADDQEDETNTNNVLYLQKVDAAGLLVDTPERITDGTFNVSYLEAEMQDDQIHLMYAANNSAIFYTATAAAPPVLLEGDANRDGVVSAGDYASVQSNFGDTGEPGLFGDANGDGVVSAGDYASVQANFGNVVAAGVIPEPATMCLLAGGGVALLKRKRNV